MADSGVLGMRGSSSVIEITDSLFFFKRAKDEDLWVNHTVFASLFNHHSGFEFASHTMPLCASLCGGFVVLQSLPVRLFKRPSIHPSFPHLSIQQPFMLGTPLRGRDVMPIRCLNNLSSSSKGREAAALRHQGY